MQHRIILDGEGTQKGKALRARTAFDGEGTQKGKALRARTAFESSSTTCRKKRGSVPSVA
jgi:hypothetical protein